VVNTGNVGRPYFYTMFGAICGAPIVFLCEYNFSPVREFGVIKISPAACSRRIVRQWLAHFLGVGSAPFFCLNLGGVGRILFFFHGFTRDLNHLDGLFTLFKK